MPLEFPALKRRQGVDLSLQSKCNGFLMIARYGYVDATRESSFPVHAPSKSNSDANVDIQVQPGNRMPGIPQPNAKLCLRCDWGERASPGANTNASRGVHARGDESNQDANGKVPD